MDKDLDPVEIRVLGCLIEKQRTTPDQYPLSLNALRNACNQTTNRNPIVSYDEEMLRAALQKLGRRRYSRLTTGHTSRAAKYRHLLDEALPLDAAEQAIMAVLFLRGEQGADHAPNLQQQDQRDCEQDDNAEHRLRGRRLPLALGVARPGPVARDPALGRLARPVVFVRAAHLICLPVIARATTRRWISDVPSKIV